MVQLTSLVCGRCRLSPDLPALGPESLPYHRRFLPACSPVTTLQCFLVFLLTSISFPPSLCSCLLLSFSPPLSCCPQSFVVALSYSFLVISLSARHSLWLQKPPLALLLPWAVQDSSTWSSHHRSKPKSRGCGPAIAPSASPGLPLR